jgi:hypothetical protein
MDATSTNGSRPAPVEDLVADALRDQILGVISDDDGPGGSGLTGAGGAEPIASRHRMAGGRETGSGEAHARPARSRPLIGC